MKSVKLPVKDQSSNYEIRLESIGGLGANLCGKMFGELGLRYLGLNSSSFSSYGSEKTGTPVKAYIRYCEPDREIRVHSPVKTPHLLGIFHEALLTDETVLYGCTEDTRVVVNIEMPPEEAENKYPELFLLPVKELFFVQAQKIAMETHSRINTVMLGAMARVMGFVRLEEVTGICKDALGTKYPEALPCNIEGVKRGYEQIIAVKASGQQKQKIYKNRQNAGEEPVWGYETAPIGGINTNYGNSVISDLSPSRQGFFPVFFPEKCINCGMCDSACPDMVFQFQRGVYKGRDMMVNRGLDYYHCKGCLRCVDVCPVEALIKGRETEYPVKKWFVPNQDMLRTPDYYEKAGPDGYITSESYLTEKRMEGGEV